MTYKTAPFLFLFLWLCGSAWAEEAVPIPSSVVAIVDVQRVLQESSAASRVKKQVEDQSSYFQKQIAKEESFLRDEEKKLAALRENAEADQYSAAEQKLRERFLFVERQVQARRKDLDLAYNAAMKKVREYLVDIVEKESKARGVNLVVVKQQVIWHDSTIDMTDVVLRDLNKQLPDITLDFPDKETPLFDRK
jgi:Skp family chaperone for outer membrane proteins